jgi:p-aminobenzoyl-glutamate transporter AbgT
MKPFLERWLGTIERIGNKLPDPVSLFLILIVLLMLGSSLAVMLQVTAVHPGTGETCSPRRNCRNFCSKCRRPSQPSRRSAWCW